MKKIMDGNSACALTSYLFTELAGIYPITPSSTMAEQIDEMAVKGKLNILNKPVRVVEMQSEAGAAGLVHGALQGGVLATTYTSSQGLLLMIPTIYKIVGEGLPLVMHVAARSLATHSLSIMGDHQDIYATRTTGIAMLASSSVQDAHYLSAVAHLTAIDASMPVMHFFDGFRTSHEVNKIDLLNEDELKNLINFEKIKMFKEKSLINNISTRGTAENDDVYFQNMEARNKDYDLLVDTFVNNMKKINGKTGCNYQPFNYYGDPNAENIIIAMGSVNNTIREYLSTKQNGMGLIEVHLYRPFSIKHLLDVLPKSVKRIAVLDRTKEPGAAGEPLYQDVVAATKDLDAKVIHGRYGISGKDTNLGDIDAIYNNLKTLEKFEFTIGINDDVTGLSLANTNYEIKNQNEILVYGFGSDGMVTASKNIIDILGENLYVQAYFQYDSSKSGGITKSHLRFSEQPLLSSYYITNPSYVIISYDAYLKDLNLFESISDNALILINTNLDDQAISSLLTNKEIEKLANKKVYAIDATKIAKDNNLGNKISSIMAQAFFKVSNLLNYETLSLKMSEEIKTKFRLKGENIIAANINALKAVDSAIRLVNLTPSNSIKGDNSMFNQIAKFEGNKLPVSSFMEYKNGTFFQTPLEQSPISKQIPIWDKNNCIECARCSLVCPHAAIRPVLQNVQDAPEDYFKPALGNDDLRYAIMVNEEQCTGCEVCVSVCPGKGGNKALKMGTPAGEALYKKYFQMDNIKTMPINTVKGTQLNKPLFEYSKACAGCGETPYIKLLTQIVGDKLVIANATGCSSIFGGSVPYFPYKVSWANSLFEDNAEFAMGLLEANRLNANGKSIWAIGGDGWAYDIGFSGIDQALASGTPIKILVLDTEVYSNTGGQSSKASRTGAMAKFAIGGKKTNKKDLATIAMTYDNVYVAAISLGANMNQAIRAINEAEQYNGPALIIAYAPCIAHGIEGGMKNSSKVEALATECGYWPIFRYSNDMGLVIDSNPPLFEKYEAFLNNERRYAMLKVVNETSATELLELNKLSAINRYNKLQKLIEKKATE